MTEGTPLRTAVIGGGTMGGIVVDALLRSRVADSSRVVATTRSAASGVRLRLRQPDIRVLDIETLSTANTEAVHGADLVILALKPALVAGGLREIADHVNPDALVVAVAAGIRLGTLASILPATTRLARVLPNTPSRVGRGVVGICAGRGVGPLEEGLLRRIFEPVGIVISVDEAGIDLVSAVSGSGPAYFYLLAERLAEAAVRRGMEPSTATDVAWQTLVGSAELAVARPDAQLSTLRSEVTSPRGTTERAIEVLEGVDLTELLDLAIVASLKRAAELAAST